MLTKEERRAVERLAKAYAIAERANGRHEGGMNRIYAKEIAVAANKKLRAYLDQITES